MHPQTPNTQTIAPVDEVGNSDTTEQPPADEAIELCRIVPFQHPQQQIDYSTLTSGEL